MFSVHCQKIVKNFIGLFEANFHTMAMKTYSTLVPQFIGQRQIFKIFYLLQDILIESELVAPGSINGVLSGKHYNRSVRSHKVIFEALLRLLFQQNLNSLTPQQKDETVTFIGKSISLFERISISNSCKHMSFFVTK